MDLIRTRPSGRLFRSMRPTGVGPPAAAMGPEPLAPYPLAVACRKNWFLRQPKLTGPAARVSR